MGRSITPRSWLTLFLAGGLLSLCPPPASAVDVILTVQNREAVARTAEPVTSGVPFAQGVVSDVGKLRLMRDGIEMPAQFLATARWPDASLRWVLVDFQIDLAASASASVTLLTGVSPQAVSGITIDDQADRLAVNTRASTFTFTKSELSIRGGRFQVLSNGSTYQAEPREWVVEERGAMKAVVRVTGVWRDGSRSIGNDHHGFLARIVFYRDRSDARVFFTFRNNNSFGWDEAGGAEPRQADLVLTGATLGSTTLLPSGGSYHVGSGVEKTWEIDVPASGSPVVRDSRFEADGTLAHGYATMRPLAAATPAYVSSTRAWGRVATPVTGLSTERQADFDLFERLQRAKVDPTAVQDPPGLTGTTAWGHLAVDRSSWNDYGDLRWAGNGCGTLSGNHYDWSYGMYLQFLRTGTLAFADLARVFARHEIDFDVYHTGVDGAAFNYQKNWEDRASHDNPDNCFGGGRPSHTWSQGYALQWLLTGDRRGKDAFDEIQEGVRQYVYESFNGEGRIDTDEIRIQGWLIENLVNRWRIDPTATITTIEYGVKTIPQAIRDILTTVFEREAAGGRNGSVVVQDFGDGHVRQTLQHAYFLEPAIKAYEEVFRGRDDEYAGELRGLIERMTRWLMATTYGGDNGGGGYRPLQIPAYVDDRQADQGDGQLPFLLMAANAAAFVYLETGDGNARTYARNAFRDYVRYVGAIGPDQYGDPQLRTPASYNSNIFTATESKIHGWSTRYGQYILLAESPAPTTRRHAPPHPLSSPLTH